MPACLELRARASYLRAETLLPLTGLLPQQGVRDRLREIAPTGEWMDTFIALARNTPADPWRLQVQAKFRDVGFAPFGRAPGLRGLTGAIAGNESGGHVDLDTRTAVFTWPMQFSQPVDLEMLKATLYWRRTADGLLVATPNWQMKNRDAGVRAKVAWQQPADGSSPVLTLVSVVENGNAANVRNYLPRERIAAVGFGLAESSLHGGPVVARRRGDSGAHPPFSLSRRQRHIPGPVRPRGGDPGLQ